MYADDTNFEAELRALLADGRKIEAVKRYREQTGAGLAAAKEAVEALEQGGSLPESVPLDSSVETEIASLLERGRKIEAVKLYRKRTGAGLKEAKDAVEALGRGEKVVVPYREIDRDLESQMIGLLQQGQKIEAIKVCRSRTGMGLKEAEDTVEALAEKQGLSFATGGGCLGAIVLVLLMIVAGVIDAGAANVRQFARECPWGRASVGRRTFIGNAGLNKTAGNVTQERATIVEGEFRSFPTRTGAIGQPSTAAPVHVRQPFQADLPLDGNANGPNRSAWKG